MTKSIEKRFKNYPLYSQKGQEQKRVIVKFFNPYGCGTWQITEASKTVDGKDWEMFGFCELFPNCGEWGYVRFSELANLRINMFGISMPIERDAYCGEYFINYKGKKI